MHWEPGRAPGSLLALGVRMLVAVLGLSSSLVPLAFAEAAAESPVAALERASAAEPDDAVLAYFLAVYQARAGLRDAALGTLERTLDRGNGFLPTAELFPELAGDRRFAVLRNRFERRLVRKADAETVFELRDRSLIPEGIAFDSHTGRFYVGSIARRAIYQVDLQGRARALSRPDDDLDAILGLAIDAQRRLLFAVSTSALTEAGRAALRNAVKVYDLDSGALRRSVPIPAARQLNDVAVAPDGTLLVTDSGGGAVYRVDLATDAVSVIVKPDAARGANGIAIAPDGKVAYVAASRRPLRIDLASGELTPLTLPPRENAAAIDGLYWHKGALIGVQNVTTPGRIVRLVLAADGHSVTALQTLLSHHHRAMHEPTTAALAPGGLYLLTRTFVTRYNEAGVIERPVTVQRAVVVRVPLSG